MTRKVLQHTTAWTLWFAYAFIGFYGRLTQFTPLQWCEIAYNCLSLVLATYTIAHFARRYFDRLSYIDFLRLPLKDRCRHLSNIYPFGILCVIAGYLVVSFWLDNNFFGMAYREITLQIQKRGDRLLGYVLAGIFFGYHVSTKIKLKKKLAASDQELEASNGKLEASNHQLKHYRREMYQMRNMLDKIEKKYLNAS